MVSTRAIEYCRTLPADYAASELNLEKCLRDFTDEMIRPFVYPVAPKTLNELLYLLEHSTEDRDIRAHLYGWESDSEMRSEIKTMLKSMGRAS
jgi:hypothetical protein